MEYNFDDIKPFNDDEVKEKLNLLINDPVFDEVLMYMFKAPQKVDAVKTQLSMINTIEQLQGTFIYDLVGWIINNTSDGLTSSGLEKLDHKKAYLFISNHRDIILDAAILNFLLFKNKMTTTQIAIGNNLLLYKWIENAVRLNRSFIIKRNLAPRELLEASKKVSQFIRQSITADNQSVWIAQKEGRTKDGFDKTQVSVLKMLNMSNKNDLAQGFKELNIIPVSISYEIEPCGLAKIKELMKKEHYGLAKTNKDDLKSMSMGIFNPKGRMHFSFGNPVEITFEKSRSKDQKNNQLNVLAKHIDNQIYANYKLWPYNYIAYDLLNKKPRFTGQYTPKAKEHFELMIEQALINIDFPITDIKERFLKIYANPVYNKLSTLRNIQ
jgi:1-acyl-sn-glycerol-3-phosphate acyltransferase